MCSSSKASIQLGTQKEDPHTNTLWMKKRHGKAHELCQIRLGVNQAALFSTRCFSEGVLAHATQVQIPFYLVALILSPITASQGYSYQSPLS